MLTPEERKEKKPFGKNSNLF